MGPIAARLKELGLDLPAMTTPVANYVPWVRAGSLIFVSGQITISAKKTVEYVGAVGRELTLEEGRSAARIAAVNVLAALSSALDGDLDRVRRVVKITGFVNADPSFTQHPEVVNGASDLFVEVFGDAGRHARAAVGAGSLPRGVAVEVEGIFEVA
jgi:enamine deaminase RidA (YjgF/YER057c/UK114 family)